MNKYRRIFTIVLDSVGIGAAEDAAEFGDVGANTLGHVSESVEHLNIPNLQKLGMANLCALKQVPPVEKPLGYRMVLKEASRGKDTMTGHWEMMGIHTTKPFKTFTETGFPKELIEELEKRTGHKVIGNKSASGTAIIDELAEEEIATGNMIVYTSADSVMQICGQEETFDLAELYRCCEIARELTMKEEWRVGRVIARPYVGKKVGEFVRTANRRDYALKPTGRTALDVLKEIGYSVISVGKISDIFDMEGITEKNKSKSSVHGMEQTIEIAGRDFTGLCFVNLVDFDAQWGHRRDPIGYGEELERFDVKLGELLPLLREDDLLILTADHGTDPTYKGTDHTRENVPFLAWSPSMRGGADLGVGESFGVIGATILDNFGLEMPEGAIGESVLRKIQTEERKKIMNRKDILSKVDHTLLAQDATWAQIREILDDAMKYETASACIPAAYVKQAAEYVQGKLPICTVIGFPNGYSTTATKVFETKDAVANGAAEIDMVINVGFLKDGRYGEIEDEIRQIHEACDGKLLKVIIETCLLTDEEKCKMCEIVTKAGAEYIKTSTGFSKGGATFADVKLMKEHVGEGVLVKAAGGISSFDDAEQFVELGASRLGTSRLVKILKAENPSGAGY